MTQPDDSTPLSDRRTDPDEFDEPDFADEFSPSPTDPANQPEDDPDEEVYGEDEGYEKPTGG